MKKRTKALDIPPAVKEKVWERDNHRCVFCGNKQAMPNAHVVPRAQGGLGIETNVLTLCIRCHMLLDQSARRKTLLERAYNYMTTKYEGWKREEQIYAK